MGNKWDIDRWVDEMAKNPFISFYPSLPAKQLNMNVAEVYNRLLSWVGDGKLICKYEIRCPECYSTIESMNERPSTEDELLCDKCGKVEINSDCVFPVFSFVPEYAEDIKKKSITKQSGSYGTKSCYSLC